MCKRMEGESLENYKIRRKNEWLAANKNGILLKLQTQPNRQQKRSAEFKSKHWGKNNKY